MKKADTLIQNQIESKTINFHSTFVHSRRISLEVSWMLRLDGVSGKLLRHLRFEELYEMHVK